MPTHRYLTSSLEKDSGWSSPLTHHFFLLFGWQTKKQPCFVNKEDKWLFAAGAAATHPQMCREQLCSGDLRLIKLNPDFGNTGAKAVVGLHPIQLWVIFYCSSSVFPDFDKAREHLGSAISALSSTRRTVHGLTLLRCLSHKNPPAIWSPACTPFSVSFMNIYGGKTRYTLN